MMKKYLIIVGLLAMFSCKEQDRGISPSDRNLNNINELRNELTQAPYGWKVTYFSKTDSLVFSNKDEVFKKGLSNYRNLYGYGGHYFLMKFSPDGVMRMLADFDAESATQERESQFEVKQNTFTQLSFTTNNYIHQLVNEHFSGASDFLYVRKDFHGNLVFKTANFIEPGREYVVFEKLTLQEQWSGQANNVMKSYENRKLFEAMKNPQLVIRKGSKIFFQSDVLIKTTTGSAAYNRFLKDMVRKRYYAFLATKKPNPDPNIGTPDEGNALGSGYVGTEQGISFRTGIRYDNNHVFYDFQRQDNRFVCELVRIYDPITRRYMSVSKHLYPQGEPTYFTAEIIDKK